MTRLDPVTGAIHTDAGEDGGVRIQIIDPITGLPQDVTTGTFVLTVKGSFEDDQSAAKFVHTSPAVNGVDLALASSGFVDFYWKPVDTRLLNGPYHIDLEMTLGGIIHTVHKGRFVVEKKVTTIGSAPVVAPPFETLQWIPFPFERQLQAGDFLTKNFPIARTGNMTLACVHVDATYGPTGSQGVVDVQDDPTTPTQTVHLNLNNVSGGELHQDFDVNAATLAAFVLLLSSGKKLTLKATTPNGLEQGCLYLGFKNAP